MGVSLTVRNKPPA